MNWLFCLLILIIWNIFILLLVNRYTTNVNYFRTSQLHAKPHTKPPINIKRCIMKVSMNKLDSHTHDNTLNAWAPRATLMKTSSSVVSARPHAKTVNLLFAFSTAWNTSAILTSCLGNSNFWVPDMWYILLAFGERCRTKLSTSCSWSEDVVIVNT